MLNEDRFNGEISRKANLFMPGKQRDRIAVVPGISERDNLEVKSVFLETKDNPINSSVLFVDNDSGLDFTVES